MQGKRRIAKAIRAKNKMTHTKKGAGLVSDGAKSSTTKIAAIAGARAQSETDDQEPIKNEAERSHIFCFCCLFQSSSASSTVAVVAAAAAAAAAALADSAVFGAVGLLATLAVAAGSRPPCTVKSLARRAKSSERAPNA